MHSVAFKTDWRHLAAIGVYFTEWAEQTMLSHPLRALILPFGANTRDHGNDIAKWFSAVN